MSGKKQNGQILQKNGRWYVRFWERRNVGGVIERKRVMHHLGPVTTRGKKPPADIESEAQRHMLSINFGAVAAARVVTIGDFVEGVYLPWVNLQKRPSTAKGYRDIWERHLRPTCTAVWLKNVRTHHVQTWLDQLGARGLSSNTLKHIKSLVSGIFKLAKQQDYFHAENPAHETSINSRAPRPKKTHAYSLQEVETILSVLPEPSATAFAIAAFMGLRAGEIRGLLWENYRDGEIHITQSIWHGLATEPKTAKSAAPVPVIRPLAARLEIHRLRCGNPQSGPVFANPSGAPLAMVTMTNLQIRPALNACVTCGRGEAEHETATHRYQRNERMPAWQGWHAARRGLGTKLRALGVPAEVIQRILRHDNVATTQMHYILTSDDEMRVAMNTLEMHLGSQTKQSDTNRTPEAVSFDGSETIN